MASDLPKKSKHTADVEKLSVAKLAVENHPENSEASPFTAEQRQILGNVYQLILSWRRERLMKAAPPVALTPSNLAPAEREA